jgi:mediator of RNA polymerase II transcription subunit 13
MSVVENDPDAHLIEVEDESCGLLFKPHFSAVAGMDGMANGAIVRRGKGSSGERGMLGVSLCWTIQVKPQGTVDTGSARQAEVTLREVLKMYRALSVLTRARGLHEGERELLPVHLAVACKGARALEGMLYEAADDER